MEPLSGHILVVGLGVSGEATAAYCATHANAGEPVRVTVVDSGASEILARRAARLRDMGVEVMLGTESVPGTYDLAVASPGIPPHAPIMVQARAAANKTISEIEFAYRRSVAPWIAVTGTNGKTTVTSLIGHLLSDAGVPASEVGNIGTPAIALVDEVGLTGAFVAEVSSFQLSLTERFHPRVSVFLNVTPDHLDYHGNMERYTEDKGRVFTLQGGDDTAVIDRDDPGAARFIEPVRKRGVRVIEVSTRGVPQGGAGLAADGMLVIDGREGYVPLVHRDELLIRGTHNVSNALAAAAAASAFGVSAEYVRASLRTFAPIAHRLEPVGTIGGVEYFNDSKATNPDAAIKALEAFAGRQVIMLLGGRNKGSDFVDLGEALAAAGASAVVFGEAAEKIAADIGAQDVHYKRADNLASAAEEAISEATEGSVVVLAPACASFDEFADYAERGRAFRELVIAHAEGGE